MSVAVTEADGEPAEHGAALSIGQVLKRLEVEFPDVTISKIRFLETEGLVEPARAASGYRKFSSADVDRLHYVLRAQRDHYLPLRVIKQQLSAIDRGLLAPIGAGDDMAQAGGGRRADGSRDPLDPVALMPTEEFSTPAEFAGPPVALRITPPELLTQAGITQSVLDELVTYRLLPPPVDGYFDAQALAIAKTAGQLAGFGLQPRHLRAFKLAADREVGLFEQVLVPLRRRGTAETADETRQVLSVLSVRLHALLVQAALGGS